MNISFYHKNVKSLSQPSKEFVEEKLHHLESVGRVDSARVEVDQQKGAHAHGDFHVSIQLNGGSHVYYAEATHTDLHSCVEHVHAELRTQMLADRGRVRDLMRRGARSLKKKLTIDKKARL